MKNLKNWKKFNESKQDSVNISGFNLVYQKNSSTIRTTPENYLVAVVDGDDIIMKKEKNGDDWSGVMDSMVKNIDQDAVKKAWENGDIPEFVKY